MIIGDYARKSDDSAGRCFSGYYGSKIQELLTPLNYDVHKTYRTCIVKRYIKGLGVGTYAGDKKILKECFEVEELNKDELLKILIAEINQIKPVVIIALGEYALRTLTGKEGIGNWRGSVLGFAPELQLFITHPNIRIVAAQHPSILHTAEELVYPMRMDYKKAVDLLFDPSKPIDNHDITIARNFGDALRFVDSYRSTPEMTTDIETHLGFITCAAISFDGQRGLCIPMYGAQMDTMEKCRMMNLLAQLCENKAINKINQNIGYDKRIYERFGFRLNPITWDTMLAAHTIAAEFPKRLGFLTSIYTDMSFYKDEGRDFDPRKDSYDQLYNYNAKDAIATFQIYKKQIEDLKDMEMLDFFVDNVMPLFDFYFRLESVGIKIDLKKRDDLINKYQSLYDLKLAELNSIAGHSININSPTQIGKFLEEKLFPVSRHRTDSGYMVVSTDKESMDKMRCAAPQEYKKCLLPYNIALRTIDLFLLLRRIDKVLEYVNVGIHPWGRVHTNVKIGGTSSGRTSGGQTADSLPYWTVEKGKDIIKFKQLGQSFQTITKHGFIIEGEDDPEIEDGIIGKDIREMYIPDTDMVFVEVDGSQAEARVVDVLAEDWDSLKEYGKVDKHCKVASMIFTQYTYEEILKLAKKEKTEEGVQMRQLGKKGKHATNYDMGDFRLSQLANINIKEAKYILSKLNIAYPRVKGVFHKQVEEAVRNTRMLENPLGRKRMFFKKVDAHYIKVAYSYIPQSTVSDWMKFALLRIDTQVDHDKVWFIAENHDSGAALVRRGYLHEYCRIARAELQKPIDFRTCTLRRDYQLIIPAEFSIGRKNWGQMREVKKLRLN